MDHSFDLRSLGASVQVLQILAILIAAGIIVAASRRISGLPLIALSAVLTAPLAVGVFLVSDPVKAFEDFLDAYWRAGRLVLDGPQQLRPMFEWGVDGFVNLPIVAFLFAPLGVLQPKLAAEVFFVVGVLALIATWIVLVRAFRLSSRDAGLALLAFGSFGPLHYSLKEGNTSHLLILPLVVGIALLRARRDLLAGMLFGAAAVIKLPLLLIGIYFLLRGRFYVVAGGLAVVVAAVAASLAVFGWDMHVLWYENCIRPFTDSPMAAFNVQSVEATFSKLTLGVEGLDDWTVQRLSGPAAISAQLINLALMAAVAIVIWRGRHNNSPLMIEGELMAIIVLACLRSPLSWSHYYVWLVLPGVFMLARAGDGQIRGRGLFVLAAGWLLAAPAVFMYDVRDWGYIAVLGNLHLLAGAMILLALLVKWRARAPRTA
jgi:alpha-1,2-mannosyltransferase